FALLRWRLIPLRVADMAGVIAITPVVSILQLNACIGLALALGLLARGLMCWGYVVLLGALFRSRGAGGLARWLAPAGRMALTNYLLQSVVSTLVFYNYGLGYFGQMPRAWQAVFALLLFVLQVIFSHAWLARFRFGPMEWLWRSATYLRPQPMRLRAQPAAGRA